MLQLIVVIVSLLSIPIFLKMKLKLRQSLMISAVILAVFSGIGLIGIQSALMDGLNSSSSRETILTVLIVTVLGGLMKHYKLLDRIVDTISIVIRNQKIVLMMVPALTGLLTVPGGALLSAPFINSLGHETGLSSERRAAINLVFRHIGMFIMPYATSILLVRTSFPDVNILTIVILNSIFVILKLIIGYNYFIKDIEIEASPASEKWFYNFGKLMVETSPIYACVVISALTDWPFYLTLVPSILIIYILSNKKDFLKKMIQSINWNTIIIVATILFMKEIILNMDNLLMLFSNILSINDSTIINFLLILTSSMFFGYITGYQSASMAIILPLIAQLNVSLSMLHVYIYLGYSASFYGYFFSPLHLCQVFTVEVMEASTTKLYKSYKGFSKFLLLAVIVVFFVASLFFK